MKRISDALTAVVGSSAYLQFGLNYRLFNLSSLARYLRPIIEARTKKTVKVSALTMALSRLQGGLSRQTRQREKSFTIDNMSVQTDLCIFTFEKTREVHQKVNALYNRLQRLHGYITVTEGVGEVNAIFEKRHLPQAQELMAERVVSRNQNIAALSVKFSARYLSMPGFLFMILQQLALQGINIVEVGSTATEFILYLDASDIQPAFDTLYNRFR